MIAARYAQAAGDHARQIGDVVKLGTIYALDEASARVQVAIGAAVSDWMPWITQRAGPDSDWWAPEPGEQVLVLSPFGDPSLGVALTGIYQNQFAPPGNVRTMRRVTFADGAVITYDRAAHALTVDLSKSDGSVTVIAKDVSVQASGSVTIDAPATHCTGKLTVDGDLVVVGSTTVQAITAGGKDIGGSHRHGNGNNGSPTTGPL